MCWIVADVVVLIVILLGNILTILAVRLSRRLRNVTSNQLILSLAISDLVVGVAVLYHLFFFVSNFLSANKATCLLRSVSTLNFYFIIIIYLYCNLFSI